MSAVRGEFDARPMPCIGSVRAIGDMRVKIEWVKGGRSGRTEIVDLAPLVLQYKLYAPIRSEEAFAQVTVGEDGETLEWQGGEIDMPATQVEDLAQEQMTGEEFGRFLERNRLNRQAAAAELGRSLRAIQLYVQSKEPIPRVVALACLGYEARKRGAYFLAAFQPHAEWEFPAVQKDDWHANGNSARIAGNQRKVIS